MQGLGQEFKVKDFFFFFFFNSNTLFQLQTTYLQNKSLQCLFTMSLHYIYKHYYTLPTTQCIFTMWDTLLTILYSNYNTTLTTYATNTTL